MNRMPIKLHAPKIKAWLADKLTDLPKGGRLLDVGAGEQQYRKYCEHLEYTSQDACQYDPSKAPEGLREPSWQYGEVDIVGDITSMAVEDGGFDGVLCADVLEHIPNPEKAIAEIERVLKPGGKLIITCPFAALVHQAPYFFSSGYSRFWYEYHLRGFDILELRPVGGYFDCVCQAVRRLKELGEQEYSGMTLDESHKVTIEKMVWLLEKLIATDKNSHVLQTGGFCVLAERRG